MNLTVTKEKAVELKLAGWGKDTKFYWCEGNSYTDYEVICGTFGLIEQNKLDEVLEDCFVMNPSRKLLWFYAPTITELLEEMDNNTILQYENDVMVGLPVGDFIDLFRSPDKLAEVWLWAKREGLIK